MEFKNKEEIEIIVEKIIEIIGETTFYDELDENYGVTDENMLSKRKMEDFIDYLNETYFLDEELGDFFDQF